MRNLLGTVAKVLDHDVPVLILGESGAGKDYLAEAIHACSTRRTGPFTRIDCATIPPDLFESELFGYEKGTFTDAQTRKLGKLEVAGGGSVYFDGFPAISARRSVGSLNTRRKPYGSAVIPAMVTRGNSRATAASVKVAARSTARIACSP